MAEPMNFAAAAQNKVKDTRLRAVQLEGHVILKLVKHCQECAPALVTGQLLGLDVGNTLEVTDCFPFPSRSNDEEEGTADVGADYQLDMMRCLREVNVDNNTVGWYQSTVMGSFQSVDLIETFINYQESIKRCIAITYDPQRSAMGGLALKAVKLRDSFIDIYKKGGVSLSAEKLKEANIGWEDIFEEIPIVVHNSPLVTALMAQIEPTSETTQADYDRLSLSLAPALEQNVEFLNDCLEDVQAEQQKLSYHHRNLARNQQQLAQWLQKRRQENAARRAAGEEPLPEEEPAQFKSPPEPSQLDYFLIANQISNYCDQVNSIAGQGLQKLYLMEGLQKARV